MNCAHGTSIPQRAALETLENRRLLSLLGVVPGFPQISTTQSGTLNYTFDSVAEVGSFDLSAAPLNYRQTAVSAQRAFLGAKSLELHFQTDGSGNLVGGVAGHDFILTGSIDLNGNFAIDAGEPTGVLLTGEVIAFGHDDVGGTDFYDLRLTVTGGVLAGDFLGSDIGIALRSDNSTFQGSFTTDFTGLVKADLGPIPSLIQPASLGDFVWEDLNKNGIQDAGEPGVPNVTVHLLDDTNTIIGTTTTNASGIYGFGNLLPGTYSVQFILPAGFQFTARDQGLNDALDSDANVVTGRTASVVLASGDQNLTLDAGLVRLVGGQGNTPGFWKQPHHFQFWTGFSPNDTYFSVFGVVHPLGIGTTLVEALDAGGGGANALGRHAVAGLLNATSPGINYLYSPQQIIQMVQQAHLTGNFQSPKKLLEKQNELGSDLKD